MVKNLNFAQIIKFWPIIKSLVKICCSVRETSFNSAYLSHRRYPQVGRKSYSYKFEIRQTFALYLMRKLDRPRCSNPRWTWTKYHHQNLVPQTRVENRFCFRKFWLSSNSKYKVFSIYFVDSHMFTGLKKYLLKFFCRNRFSRQ